MKKTTIKGLNIRLGSTTMFLTLMLAVMIGVAACSSSSSSMMDDASATAVPSIKPKPIAEAMKPSPDPRVGLKAGLFDAEEAFWNLKMLSQTPPPERFVGVTNSDLAFKGNYAFQGNYDGVIVWDVSNPKSPQLVKDFLCPASQSDVSVYGNLMFVSGEGLSGRLDCGTEGIDSTVSKDRFRGIRIFDIMNVKEPKSVANVQTCRGSHTHSVLKDPKDDENVFIYVSGSAPVRPDEELPGCSAASPDDDPNTALFRIEVIQVPLDHPEDAAIVNSPRIFDNLTAAPTHGMSPADVAELEEAKKQGAMTAVIMGQERVIPPQYVGMIVSTVAKQQRGEDAEATTADTAYVKANIQAIVDKQFGDRGGDEGAKRGPNQCHDITLYPEIGLAGGACEGYGLLLDISDPVNPKRIDAVADSNFSYWHSATFSNDGSKVLFTDEWGGGGQPKCREADPMEWGADAIFTIDNGKMNFKSYYKMPAAQTNEENCVAHNGSLIPVPGREIMVQSWYQGGISVFDWTDPNNAVEIAFHDRGPIAADHMAMGGTWSVYWYNGVLISSEIARGLDIFELEPNPYLTQNEIDAAKSVKLDYLNAQGQPKFTWPATYALAKAYVDQLDRNESMEASEIVGIRAGILASEKMSGSKKSKALSKLADKVESQSSGSMNAGKVNKLADTLRNLASM